MTVRPILLTPLILAVIGAAACHPDGADQPPAAAAKETASALQAAPAGPDAGDDAPPAGTQAAEAAGLPEPAADASGSAPRQERR